MTQEEATIEAQEYVNRVLDSQRAYGHESKPSESEYRRAVERAAQAFVGLSKPAPIPDEDSEAIPA